MDHSLFSYLVTFVLRLLSAVSIKSKSGLKDSAAACEGGYMRVVGTWDDQRPVLRAQVSSSSLSSPFHLLPVVLKCILVLFNGQQTRTALGDDFGTTLARCQRRPQ